MVYNDPILLIGKVSTRSRPKAAGTGGYGVAFHAGVSTRSRPKAAGSGKRPAHALRQCFNTQPPEGGWGGADYGFGDFMVSTRSRPKAAGR